MDGHLISHGVSRYILWPWCKPEQTPPSKDNNLSTSNFSIFFVQGCQVHDAFQRFSIYLSRVWCRWENLVNAKIFSRQIVKYNHINWSVLGRWQLKIIEGYVSEEEKLQAVCWQISNAVFGLVKFSCLVNRTHGTRGVAKTLLWRIYTGHSSCLSKSNCVFYWPITIINTKIQGCPTMPRQTWQWFFARVCYGPVLIVHHNYK